MVTKEGLVDLTYLETLWDMHLVAISCELAKWVDAAVVHGGSSRHGRGEEGLYLVGLKAVCLKPESELKHIFNASPRMGCDKIGDKVLLFTNLSDQFKYVDVNDTQLKQIQH